jgi:hypothetical protein
MARMDRSAASHATTRMLRWPVAIAAVTVCVLGVACARAQDAHAQGTFGDDTRPCLSPDLFLFETSDPPPTRLEGVPLRRLFANYSRFYRGPQADVDLVLVYERGEVVLLVPFAEGCATSLPRKIDAETWKLLSGTIWRPFGMPPPSWLGRGGEVPDAHAVISRDRLRLPRGYRG